jgi:hypothetical protein
MSSRSVDSQPPEAAWSEVERELLGAAREERMPAELEARLRDALAFAPGIVEVPSSAAQNAPFNDTARARQLFAGKLPLWGMLGIVAIGAISYYALSPGASQPSAAGTRQQVAAPAQGSVTHDVAQREVSASAQQANVAAAARREAMAREAAGAQHDGVGSASASAQADTRREAASAQRDGSERVAARARDGKRPEALSARSRAVTSAEPLVAPPMAAKDSAAQAILVHEPTDVPAPAAQSGKAATPDQLRLEAQLLEMARSALGRGALPEARQWLARYQAQFARSALQPESQVLGIELAVRTGARTTAKAQAEHFLAQHPHHPLRDRVQLLTEEPR